MWADKRKLTEVQKSHFLSNFESCPTPLYLRVACDLAQKWHSFARIEHCKLAPSMKEIINIFFDWIERKHGELLVHYAFGCIIYPFSRLVQPYLPPPPVIFWFNICLYITATKYRVSNNKFEDLLACISEVLTDVYEWCVSFHQENGLPNKIYH